MGKIRVSYTYQNYPNCPRATEISKSREGAKFGLRYLAVIGIFMGIGMFYQNVALAAVILLSSVVFLIYMGTGYNTRTEKNIQKALNEQVSTQQMLRESKYQCDALTRLNDAGVGQCMNCYTKNVKLARYRVKRGSETREMPICEACAAKLTASLPENRAKNQGSAAPAPNAASTPLTPQQKALEMEFVQDFLQSNSEPLGNRQEAWTWMMGRMRYYRQKGLGTGELYALASNMMLFLTDTYSQRITEFLQVAEPAMIVAQVAQLLKEEKNDKARQVAQPLWDYFGKNQNSLALKKEEIIILAMAVSMNKPKQQ